MKPKNNGFKELSSKRTLTSFPKPLKVKCFKCAKSFLVKFVIPRLTYSQKNNWEYWTGQGKDKKICDACLHNFYYDKETYWETIKDLKKRNILRTYIYDGIIKG